MEVRRNKILSEILGITQLKQSAALDLLHMLERFEKLGKKTKKLHPYLDRLAENRVDTHTNISTSVVLN